MNDVHRELYDRIQRFEFDEPSTSRRFVHRLAHDQGWSIAFATRAIDEYRRFLLLATVGENAVCPSDVVDDVWHQHLIYTRSYWQRLCGEVLGRPLHHDPSRGGPTELARHRQMYLDTLARYAEVFGERPPADIWPGVESRFLAPVSASGRKHWPRIRGRRSGVVLGSIGSVLLAADARLLAIQNPLDLRGRDFLVLYMVLMMVMLLIGFAIRTWARIREFAPHGDAPPLNPYEVAYLVGGDTRAINAAIASLNEANVISVVASHPPTFKLKRKPKEFSDPLDEALVSTPRLESGVQHSSLKWNSRRPMAATRGKLQELGLIVSPANQWLGVVVPTLAVLILSGLGFAKILVGISRERPVSILAVLTLATFFGGCIAFGRKLHCTPAAEKLLARLKSEHKAYSRPQVYRTEPLEGQELALAVALFGVGVTATALPGYHEAMRTRTTYGSGWGSGCSSGCGGGGCGGGGCGGGGCGGGGCGGCS